MKPAWTGELIGLMHNEDITFDELSREMGVSKGYISMILNGSRSPADAEGKVRAAVEAIRLRKS